MISRLKRPLKSFGSSWNNFLDKRVGGKSFAKEVVKRTWPIYMASFMSLLVGFIDQAMVSLIPNTDTVLSLAAIAAASEINFIFTVTISSVVSMGLIFFAQYMGAKNQRKMEECVSTLSFAAVFMAVFFVLIVNFLGKDLVGIFLVTESTINESFEYLKLVSYSWIFLALMQSITWTMSRFRRPHIAIYVSAVSLILNIILNYLYITGTGVPALGTRGIGLATFITRIAEAGVAISAVFVFRDTIFKGILNPTEFSWIVFKKMLGKWLLIVNELLWSTALVFQVWVLSRRGEIATAAVGAAFSIGGILYASFGSFSVAVSYYIGTALGASDFKSAKEYARRIVNLAAMFLSFYSVVFFSISFGIVKLFTPETTLIDPQQFESTILYMIWITTATMTLGGLQLVYVNCLWAGGRVIKAFIGDVLMSWIAIGVGALLVFYTSIDYLPLFAVMFFTNDIIKFLCLRYFYKQYRWFHNLTIEKRETNFMKRMKTLMRIKKNDVK